jgi:phosphoserine phosphatase RsbU/P
MTTQPSSITQFLTDGSLATLCNAATVLLGSGVQLIDEQGQHVIVSRDGDTQSLSVEHENPVETFVCSAPIEVRRHRIGALAIGDGPSWRDHPEVTRRWLGSLASIIGEFCENRVSLSGFVEEIDVLDTLTRHLVTGKGLEAILDDGLRSAVRLMDADAGTLRTFDASTHELRLAASVGFSELYQREAATLSADEALAKAAMVGEAVAVDDIASDTQLLRSEFIAAEGYRSMLSTGLEFQRESLGIVRLYSRVPARFSGADKAKLTSISRQIATALAIDGLIDDRTSADTLRRQVHNASLIQQRMLPREFPSTPTLDIHAEFEPSLELAGDFYDVFALGDRTAFVVGDVVGKGIPAALLMANVRASLRAYARNEIETNDIAHIVTRTNRALCRDSQPSEFATLVCGSIDPRTNVLRLCSAGHEPTILARCVGDTVRLDRFDEGGIPVGIDPDTTYESQDIQLESGDTLMMLSDGLPEAMNFKQQLYGRERVHEALRVFMEQHPSATAKQVAQHLLWEMRRFTGLQYKSDDATIVAIRIAE